MNGTLKNLSDEELLGRWRDGDSKAGNEIFRRYHHRIFCFFKLKLGAYNCDELVQKTFLGLVEGLPRFRGEGTVRSLIYAIARNQFYSHIRGLVRDRERFDPDHSSLADLGPTPTQELAAADEQRLLVLALRELPLDRQLLFELRYWEGMEPKEIALVFDIPPGTVRARFHRACTQLAEHMRRLSSSKEELERSLCGLSTWAAQIRERADLFEP